MATKRQESVGQLQLDLDHLAQATAKGFAEADKRFDQIIANMATKEDLKQFATKEDLKQFATKEDLKQFATKEDLKRQMTPLLAVLRSIDQQLHEHTTHPDRIARLERSVFRR